MQKKFKGILLYIKIYKENDLFVKFLSNNDEIITGVVYGGQSKKKRNIFQLGFFLNFNVTLFANRPSSISAELCTPFIAQILNDKYKLNCILSLISLINLSIIEGQKIDHIYSITDKFMNLMISNKNWISDYCLFLMNLLKIIGYEIRFNNNNLKYFDMQNLDFVDKKNNNCVLFPFELFDGKKKYINYGSINTVFSIFENIFIKNHLSTINLHLPNQFLLFKKLILDYLKINDKDFK